jgi:predicted NUDIX family NTP pyrophosphohydrolase
VCVDREYQAVIGATVSETFEDADGRERIGTKSSIFRRDWSSMNAKVSTLAPVDKAELTAPIALAETRVKFRTGERGDLLAKPCLLV